VKRAREIQQLIEMEKAWIEKLSATTSQAAVLLADDDSRPQWAIECRRDIVSRQVLFAEVLTLMLRSDVIRLELSLDEVNGNGGEWYWKVLYKALEIVGIAILAVLGIKVTGA